MVDSIAGRVSNAVQAAVKAAAEAAAKAAAEAAAKLAAEAAKQKAPAGVNATTSFDGNKVGDAAPKKTPNDLAVQNYKESGDKVFDLSKPEGREGLVVMSPQIDDLDKTTNDKSRCGAACIVDSMILDGDHKANAQALKKMKTEFKVKTTPEEDAALDAFEKGKMTPHQAAHLQEFMMKTAEALPPNPPGSQNVDIQARKNDKGERVDVNFGLSSFGMANLVSHINARGGMKNAANVEFRGEVRQGEKGPFNHWTMVSRDKKLFPTTIDPLPGEGGMTQLKHTEPDAQPSFVQDDRPGFQDRMMPNPKFLAQVVVYPKDGKDKETLIDIRTTGVKPPTGPENSYGHVRYKVPPGAKEVPPPEMNFRDRETHEVVG